MQLVRATSLNETQVLGQLINLGRSDCPIPLQRLIQYQRATRAVESRNRPFFLWPFSLQSLISYKIVGEAGIILSAFGSWMQALWDNGGPDGPSMLFRPTELLATIDAW